MGELARRLLWRADRRARPHASQPGSRRSVSNPEEAILELMRRGAGEENAAAESTSGRAREHEPESGTTKRLPLGGEGPSRMDIPREPKGKKRKIVLIALGAVALLAITLLLARLEPAAPSVNRDVLLFGTVERGSFVREVRGPGTLVPERITFIAALSGGRVEQVHAQPGEELQAGALLLEMTNPDVELEALQAQQQLTAARAGLLELRRSLASERLAQEAAVAIAHAEYEEARRRAEADSALIARQLISMSEASRSRELAEARRVGYEAERRRLELLEQTMDEQIAVQEEQTQRLASILSYQRRRVESMRVAAPVDGVLQDLNLEVGQWVQSGTTLARIAQPGRLKAELRIPETQVRDVQVGQAALIDTRTDKVEGRVRRVDPNVQNASVLVEVSIEGDLPPGARPDLSVDGTIEIERLEDVLHVDRPAYGQSHATVSLFKVARGGSEAVRVPVRLGRSSVNRIEIVEGLEQGEVIILSDMSRYDDTDRVRIR